MSDPAAVSAQADGTPASELVLEIRKGQLLRLERPAAAVFVADPERLIEGRLARTSMRPGEEPALAVGRRRLVGPAGFMLD